MQNFINYLEKENIIGNLYQFYNVELNDQTIDNFLNRIIKILKSLKNSEKTISLDIFAIEFDVFTKIYEDMRNHKEKKKLGEFYTPSPVVKYILDAVEYNYLKEIETKKIIDISCGSGSFIVQIIRILIKRYLKIYKKQRVSDLTFKEAKNIISAIKENIFGIDINRTACILCQINIHFILFELLSLILSSESDYLLPKFNIKNINALTINYREKYDYVVGNPPYLFIREIPIDQIPIIENNNFKTKIGQFDYYQLFIELGIRILVPNGMFGYIVPDSILVLSNRLVIRKYIYNNTKIKEIYHTGPKFNEAVVSNIIIILEKENKILERQNNQIKLKLSNHHEETIPQNTIESWNYQFLIHLNKTDIAILEHLNTNFPKLKDLFEKYNVKLILRRGVELTKTGKIIFCETCNKYLPIPRNRLKCSSCNSDLNEGNIENLIHEAIPTDGIKENFNLFLYSIKRYQKTQYKFIDTSKVGINYKDFEIYEDRIVIRQLPQNLKICATYDKKLSLTSQSFYNLKITKSDISEFNNFYLLGLFNSMLFSYFFIKSFGTYKKLFPRILIEKIKDFPIKIPKTNNEKEIAKNITENVKLILDATHKLEHLQQTIDLLIFDLYQIPENNRKYILDYIETLNS